MADDKTETSQKIVMVWTKEMDVIFAKEISAEGVFHSKPRSNERGACWQRVVNNLNASQEFNVNVKALRDRFRTLAGKVKARQAKEKKASGGGEEDVTEIDILLEDLVELKEQKDTELEKANEAKKANEDKERGQALEMRDRAMERFGETRKREKETDDGKTQKGDKKRRSGGDTVEFLRLKVETDREMREKEIEEKKAERKEERERQDLLRHELEMQRKAQENQAMQQQQQFQLMQQQFMGFMAQQAQMFAQLLKK